MVDAEGNTFSVPPDRTSKQVFQCCMARKAAPMKCCRAIANGADAGKGQIYSEGSGDDRARSWQLTLNNDIKLNLGRGDT